MDPNGGYVVMHPADVALDINIPSGYMLNADYRAAVAEASADRWPDAQMLPGYREATLSFMAVLAIRVILPVLLVVGLYVLAAKCKERSRRKRETENVRKGK